MISLGKKRATRRRKFIPSAIGVPNSVGTDPFSRVIDKFRVLRVSGSHRISAVKMRQPLAVNGYTQFAGRRVTRLVGAVINDANDATPCVVFARVHFARLDVPREWHRFFLQARIAFWEIWDHEKIEQEMDDFDGDAVRLVDYARWIGGLRMRSKTAVADADANDMTHIRLLFQKSRSMTLTPDSLGLESNCHVVVLEHIIFLNKIVNRSTRSGVLETEAELARARLRSSFGKKNDIRRHIHPLDDKV